MPASRDAYAGEWVARARELAPAIQAHRDDGERQRRLTAVLFQELRRAGMFNLTVPRAFGGAEVDITTFVSVIEELSRHDGSVGWNAMIAGSYGFLADYLPEATAKAIFGSGDALVAGTLAPTGQADRMPGGYAGVRPWAGGLAEAPASPRAGSRARGAGRAHRLTQGRTGRGMGGGRRWWLVVRGGLARADARDGVARGRNRRSPAMPPWQK